LINSPSFDERKYGEEIRAKYGDETVNKSNHKFKKMETFQLAFKTGDPAGELAQKAVDDPRFTVIYDQKQPGTAAFLRDAIQIYTQR